MSSPAAARGREVRQRLLAAAAELIPERGWTAVSTRVLAERAGVTPSVVHYHFPSVSAVLNEAALDVMRRVLDELDAVLDGAASAAEVIDAVLASAQEVAGSDPTLLLVVESYLAASRDDGLREQIGTLVTEFRGRLARRLGEHGVAAPADTAAVLAATLDGVFLHRGLGSGPDLTAVASVLHRLVRPQHVREHTA
ncbi:TetR/AcrR family transcriptional regulator [Prauserella muralis]|uniref:TetR family transcriptional regulator n=1 Tax=Prauserella muralis TaxID=588067 RepID=A0A2V4AKH4_9PSEU|nr:TetR/AcrR family transcriptional regulator [Prauserella muralis]PXY20712.1 TetR family transcriptional regulator [Prauserella muralis]TWE29719.1 TetR family transcriptional regulator [Prauserella muralis]